MVQAGRAHVVGVSHDELEQKVVPLVATMGLDFDDAYQYAVATEFGLTIVSFDAHFDRTARGRVTPAQVLNP